MAIPNTWGTSWHFYGSTSTPIWKFPKMGVPLNHPFSMGFSLINQPFLGTPHLWKPPYERICETMWNHLKPPKPESKVWPSNLGEVSSTGSRRSHWCYPQLPSTAFLQDMPDPFLSLKPCSPTSQFRTGKVFASIHRWDTLPQDPRIDGSRENSLYLLAKTCKNNVFL